MSYAPFGFQSFVRAIPLWLKKKIWISDIIQKELAYRGKLLFPSHHESHAGSAFFPSPFEEAAILTIDGVGEWATSSYGVGKRNELDTMGELHFPHSLGLLYSAFTYFTGFRVNSGEYKVMGLAPYGSPKYVQTIYDHLIDLKPDGSFKLNMKYFNYCQGLTMTNRHFSDLFGGPPRARESDLTQREMDLACSIQDVTEEVMLRMARHVKKVTGQRNLCLAGGVALNCVGNGKLLKSGLFDEIWVQPAAGDAGGALGAAMVAYHCYFKKPLKTKYGKDTQRGSYLGPRYDDAYIQTVLDQYKATYTIRSDEELYRTIARALSSEKVIGWFQGAMEFGPRALGNRSILGDPRSETMQKTMNVKIKYRESFRPFAPSVLTEQTKEWFDLDQKSPYMLFVADVAKHKQIPMTHDQKNLWGIDALNIVRSEIPAVTHVDYSARVQTVDEETNCPVLINTSFNVRGEPIVESPTDAYRCFMRTEMDILVLGNIILYKNEQPVYAAEESWRQEYELD